MSLTFREGAATAERLTLWRKIFRFNWGLALLIAAAACIGFLMLVSVAGGDLAPWAGRQMVRFGIGLGVMAIVAMIDLRFWRVTAPALYLGALALLIGVEVLGVTGMGAQRWIDFGFFRLQPSELMKVALIVALAAYYAWLDPDDTSRLVWMVPPLALIALPALMVLRQPALGTAILLTVGGLGVMLVASLRPAPLEKYEDEQHEQGDELNERGQITVGHGASSPGAGAELPHQCVHPMLGRCGAAAGTPAAAIRITPCADRRGCRCRPGR